MKLTVNLHEKLIQYNEVKSNTQEDLILKEANQILENSQQEDLSILAKIGLGKNISEAQKINNKRSIESQFDEVYDIKAIEKLAINYRLRFLPSDLYSGTIDPLLATKVKEFINKHNVDTSVPRQRYSWVDSSKFFILAPASSFALQERPKDPIMLYKINNEKYAFVHKWGNDFTWYRKLVSYPFRSAGACFISVAFLIVVCSYLLARSVSVSEDNFWAIFGISTLLGFPVIGLLHCAFMLSWGINNDFNFDFSNDVWDSKFRN